MDIKNGTFGASALEKGDFQAAASASGVASLSRQDVDLGVSEGLLSGAGLSAINTAGLTQVRIRFGLDDDDDGLADRYGFYSGENATYAPILEVTFLP